MGDRMDFAAIDVADPGGVRGLAAGAAIAAVSCEPPDSKQTSVCQIHPAIDPGALCNDGTLPAFWFRPGSGAATWVVWLEGGGQCTCVAG
jgi:hypothetical protein